MDLMWRSLLQKGRCGKYEEGREQENGSKRECSKTECSKTGKKEEKAFFHYLQEDPVIESAANDHCVRTGGDRGL